MPLAPLTCCSIGAATDSATTCELAPGKLVATCTCGGTICGYCAIGRLNPASAPASRITSDRTVEKIGRSMKKFSTVGQPPGKGSAAMAVGRVAVGREHRLDGRPGRDFLQAVDDHDFSGLQAAVGHPVGAEPLGGLYLAHRRLVVGADHVDRLQPLQL